MAIGLPDNLYMYVLVCQFITPPLWGAAEFVQIHSNPVKLDYWNILNCGQQAMKLLIANQKGYSFICFYYDLFSKNLRH